MYTISISQEIKEACPVFAGAAVYAKVRNTTYSEGLWREITEAVFHPRTTVARGVLREECEELMSGFFAGLRG